MGVLKGDDKGAPASAPERTARSSVAHGDAAGLPALRPAGNAQVLHLPGAQLKGPLREESLT